LFLKEASKLDKKLPDATGFCSRYFFNDTGKKNCTFEITFKPGNYHITFHVLLFITDQKPARRRRACLVGRKVPD